jgi:hypothetical protein
MRQTRILIALAAACVTIAVAMFISIHTVHGQSALQVYNPWLASGAMSAQSADAQNAGAFSGPIYDPYPPGILPADLGSEIKRVLREVDLLEDRAVVRWKALPPPTLTGQPPTLQGSGTEAIETLGELMNYDRNMSPKRDQACSSCHMPYAGFSGPIPSVNLTMIAYPGTEHFRAGKRTAQRYTILPPRRPGLTSRKSSSTMATSRA